MNDLFQRENQVFNQTVYLVLLHCGVRKDWASPIPPPPKCFYLSIYLFSLSFQTNKFIGTSTLWGGERLGWPFLSPPKCFDLSFYCLVFQFMLLLDCI